MLSDDRVTSSPSPFPSNVTVKDVCSFSFQVANNLCGFVVLTRESSLIGSFSPLIHPVKSYPSLEAEGSDSIFPYGSPISTVIADFSHSPPLGSNVTVIVCGAGFSSSSGSSSGSSPGSPPPELPLREVLVFLFSGCISASSGSGVSAKGSYSSSLLASPSSKTSSSSGADPRPLKIGFLASPRPSASLLI